MVVYRSRTGRTRRCGEDIAAYLRTRGVVASVASVGDCDMDQLANVDYLLLGCWTNGLFVVLQHPDEPWLAFVRDLPANVRARVGLFTTYQLLTGSMFAKMLPEFGRPEAHRLNLYREKGKGGQHNRRQSMPSSFSYAP